jgi:hypothetical protein
MLKLHRLKVVLKYFCSKNVKSYNHILFFHYYCILNLIKIYLMFTDNDLTVLSKKGIDKKVIENQLSFFKKGFPFLRIIKEATIGDGIIQPSVEKQKDFLQLWEKYLLGQNTIVKFVPASGAASRMFKDLFEFTESQEQIPTNKHVKAFFEQLKNFAFYSLLNKLCIDKTSKDITQLLIANEYKTIIRLFLSDEGLNYGTLP